MATHYHAGTQTAANTTSDWYYLDDNTTGGTKYRFEHIPPSLENPLGVIQVKIKEEEKVKQEENKFLAKLTRGMEEEQIDTLYEILEQPGWEKRVMLAFLASAVKDDNMTMEALGYEKSEE